MTVFNYRIDHGVEWTRAKLQFGDEDSVPGSD